MKHFIIVLLIIMLFPLEWVYGQNLTVLYFKRPPYYDTINNQADGFLVQLTRPDIPPGNRRYIIFSKAVEDSLIERINQSIKEKYF